eukprot:SAG11_NODE_158_length_14064_cov_6.063860_4_plen_47_part_00
MQTVNQKIDRIGAPHSVHVHYCRIDTFSAALTTQADRKGLLKPFVF